MRGPLQPLGEINTTLRGLITRLITNPGRIRRRACGLWRGALFLNPHIHWHRISYPVSPTVP